MSLCLLMIVLFKDVTGYAIWLRTFAGNVMPNPQENPKEIYKEFEITGCWELASSLSNIGHRSNVTSTRNVDSISAKILPI